MTVAGRWLASALLASAVSLGACASGPRSAVRAELRAHDVGGALEAYERVRASDGADPGLLRDVAALVLEEAAQSADLGVRDAAFSQLRRARERGRTALVSLAHSPDDAVRAMALEVQASAGDALARTQLRASVAAGEHVTRAAAQGALDPRDSDDLTALGQSLLDPSARVRRAAALRLRLAGEDDATRAALALATRVDPATAVRVAALQALARQGAQAFPQVRERLNDPEPSVRMAALLALHVCDPQQATGVLTAFLATAPGSDSIEAARLLATRATAQAAPEDGDEATTAAVRATAYLLGALFAEDDSARAQVAVALSSLPALESAHLDANAAPLEALIAARVQQESVRQTRVVLAQILLRAADTLALGTAALHEVLSGDDVPAILAAAALARLGDELALARLDSALHEPRATHRRIAAAALAWEADDPDRARTALTDDDAWVRVAVAGGILAAR